MAKRIYKYDVPVKDLTELTLPVGSEILSIEVQAGIPRLWAIVDPDQTQVEVHKIRMYGTGHIMEDGEELVHLSTFQMQGGTYIFHAFLVVD